MYKNLIKKHLENNLSEATAPAIQLANKIAKDNKKINTKELKDIAKDLSGYEKSSMTAKDEKEIAHNKINYNSDEEKTYHDEMEIMNGQEMITYSREPNETFSERALEGIEGSSRMGNNPEWANVVAKGQGGDPEFGKNLVKKIKSSIKKRKDAEKNWFALGDDIEFDPTIYKKFEGKPHAFESTEKKKTINEEIGRDYTHFLVSKSDNKIIDGFDYADMGPDEIRSYLKLDIVDKGLDPKKYKLVSGSYLERNGINPFDESNWKNQGEELPEVHKKFKGKPHAFESTKRKKTINENYDDLIDFTIPEWAMSSLINGDDSGLEDEDISKIDNFVKQVASEYGNANFMLGDIEGKDDLGFCRQNDIDNLGSNCYRLYIKPSTDTQDPMKGLDTDYERDSRSQQYGINPYNDISESKQKNKKQTQIKESMKRLKFKTEFNGFGNAIKLIPESYKVDQKTFEMTDGNETYKIRWEGSVNEGKAVILVASDKKLVSEDIQRMKNLFSYKSEDTLGTLKGNARIDENKTFGDIWKKTKTLLEMEDIEGTDGEHGDWDDAITSQAAEAKKHVEGSVSKEKGTHAKAATGNWDDVKKSAPEATKHVQGSASSEKGTKAPKPKHGDWDDAVTSQAAEAKKHLTKESMDDLGEGAVNFMDIAAPATAFASVVAPFIYTYLKGYKAKEAVAKAAKGGELTDDEIKAIKSELSAEMAGGIEKSIDRSPSDLGNL